MNPILSVFLEILKFTIPALIVFFTVYFLFKKYLDSQIQLKAMENRKLFANQTLPLKLQAYERLMVLCDRISIPNLISRLRTNAMSNKELQNAMMIAVQQEFEHNNAMQIYTSEKLWEIISLAKNQTLAIIASANEGLNDSDNAGLFAEKVLKEQMKQSTASVDVAKSAIKKEVQLIL